MIKIERKVYKYIFSFVFMAYRLITGTDIKKGSVIMVEGEPCTVKSIDISRPGKHGHAKLRIEAVGITDGKKRVLAKPGHDKFEVPMINKKKAQVLSISDNTASIMDLESFETIDVPFGDELKEEIKPEAQVEYWDIEGIKIIKRMV